MQKADRLLHICLKRCRAGVRVLPILLRVVIAVRGSGAGQRSMEMRDPASVQHLNETG
jgi:hypothetical protein